MESLLINKLEAVKELRNYTKEIIELSLKIEYNKVNSMIDERQQFIEKINTINEEIKNSNFSETSKVKNIKKEIREILKETADMDNIIRKNISNELKNVKKSLNQPDNHSKALNIKA